MKDLKKLGCLGVIIALVWFPIGVILELTKRRKYR